VGEVEPKDTWEEKERENMKQLGSFEEILKTFTLARV